MNKHVWITSVLVASLGMAGCDSRTVATRPTHIQSASQETSPPPALVSAARLAVADFTITVHPGYSSEARFTLTEIGGISGATIDTVEVWTPQEHDVTGQSCWKSPIRVEASGTLDAFSARYKSLSYCAPYFDGEIVDGVSLVVAFIDDQGARGTVNATTHTIIR